MTIVTLDRTRYFYFSEKEQSITNGLMKKKKKKGGGGNKIERRDTCYPRSIYDLLSLAPFIFVPMGQFTGRKSSD